MTNKILKKQRLNHTRVDIPKVIQECRSSKGHTRVGLPQVIQRLVYKKTGHWRFGLPKDSSYNKRYTRWSSKSMVSKKISFLSSGYTRYGISNFNFSNHFIFRSTIIQKEYWVNTSNSGLLFLQGHHLPNSQCFCTDRIYRIYLQFLNIIIIRPDFTRTTKKQKSTIESIEYTIKKES